PQGLADERRLPVLAPVELALVRNMQPDAGTRESERDDAEIAGALEFISRARRLPPRRRELRDRLHSPAEGLQESCHDARGDLGPVLGWAEDPEPRVGVVDFRGGPAGILVDLLLQLSDLVH